MSHASTSAARKPRSAETSTLSRAKTTCSAVTQRLIVANLDPASRSVAPAMGEPSSSVHVAASASNVSSTSSNASKVLASIASRTAYTTYLLPRSDGRSGARSAGSDTCSSWSVNRYWALFEAAQSAARAGSPDRDYYRQAAERLGANRACLSVARKLLKRSYHTLRELGEEGLQPA